MKRKNSEWQRLVAAARQAPADPDSPAPYGYSTRVVAEAQSLSRGWGLSAFAQFSWPALAVATLVMAVTVAANFQQVVNGVADDAATLAEPLLDSEDSAT